MENIVLIGMPSSGKSTAGKLLAQTVGYGFIDCDLLIQKEEGAPLSEIIETKGIEGFLEVEERINAGLYTDRCVIATGGSVCYLPRAMEHLKRIGKIIYLEIGEGEAEKRISDFVGRGVVMRGDVKNLRDLYRQRAPLYKKFADITVQCDQLTVSDTVAAIAKAAGFEI